MSFKDLKKKGSNLADLQSKLEESTSFSTKDERLWYVERDKAGNGYAIIRFLPPPDGEDMPFVKLYSHGFQGPGGWYIENSLTTIGKPDPLSLYNRELWNSGDEELKNQVRKQKRKLNYYSNIYVVKDPSNPENEGQVFLFRYGKKIHDKIMDAVNGDELEGREGFNPFDFWTGANFKLRVRKVEGYPNYDTSSFEEPGVLEGLDDAQLEAIWKREHKLQPLIAEDQFKSYEELQERLNIVLGRTTPTPTPANTPQENIVSTKPVFTKPKSEDGEDFYIKKEDEIDPNYLDTQSNDEENDPLSYFQKLANS